MFSSLLRTSLSCFLFVILLQISSAVAGNQIIFGNPEYGRMPEIDSNDVAVPIDPVKPVYPIDAALNHYEATVVFKVRIAQDSTVKQVTIEYCSNRDKGFESAATSAVKAARFAPPSGPDRKSRERWLYYIVIFRAYDMYLGDVLPSVDEITPVDEPAKELKKVMVAPVTVDSPIRFEVTLKLLVDTFGLVRQVIMTESSGHPKVDTQIYKTAFWTTFSPAREDGRPVAAWTDWNFRFNVPSYYVNPSDSTDLIRWAEPRASLIRINVKTASKFIGYVPSPGFAGLNVEGVSNIRLMSDPIDFIFDVPVKVQATATGKIDSIVFREADSLAPWIRETMPPVLQKLNLATSSQWSPSLSSADSNWVSHQTGFYFVLDGPSFKLAELPFADEFLPFDVAPEPLQAREVRYPKVALMGNFESTVWVSALVDQDGWVRWAYISKATGFPEFDQAALHSAVHVRYKPATLANQPVQTWITYKIDFALPKNAAGPAPSGEKK